jgi:hypothetical protein
MSAAEKRPAPDSLFPPTEQQSQAAASVAKLVAGRLEAAKKPKTFRGASKGSVERAREQMNSMAERGEWDDASGTHLVALYEWLHEKVYGVATAELDARTWAVASQMAGRMVEQQFDNDFGKAVVFMRWVWRREHEREAWRRENGKQGARIGWRLMWNGSLVTDYKVDCARRPTR